MITSRHSLAVRAARALALFVLVSAGLAPLAVAQAGARLPRIGFLSISPPAPSGPAQAVAKALNDLGHVDGRTVVFEFRDAAWDPTRLAEMANDLVERSKVDVLVALTNIPGFAAKRATTRVPIVVWGIHGAVETGLVPDLARPSRNVTGIESLAPELDAKRIALLKELQPRLARLGVIYNADDPGSAFHLASAREAARRLGVSLVALPVRRPADFDTALAEERGASIDALLVLADRLTSLHWERLSGFAARHRLPTACEFRFLAQAGCLVAYGPSPAEFTVRVAEQVHKILSGARPAEVPVERTTRFELAINLKTARSLGIDIPAAVRIAADDVIE